MECAIERGKLAAALGMVKSAVCANGLPVLRCVRLEATEDGHAEVSATNLDVYVTAKADASVASPGVAVVNHETLARTVATMPEGDVKLSTAEGNGLVRLKVRCGSSRSAIYAMKPEEWPVVDSGKGKSQKFCMDAKVLRRAIMSVLHAASRDTTRQNLISVCLETAKDGFVAVAADGRRMAAFCHPAAKSPPPKAKDARTVTLPLRLASVISSLLADAAGDVVAEIGDRFFSARTDDWSVNGKVIDEKYPNWRQVIPGPDQYGARVEADRSELLRALHAVEVSGSEIDRGGLFAVMKIAPSGLVSFDSVTDGSSSHAELKAGGDLPAKAVTCGINIKNYLDALGASVDDEVEMLLSPDIPPVMFRSAFGLIEVVMGVKPGMTLAQAINGNNGNGED